MSISKKTHQDGQGGTGFSILRPRFVMMTRGPHQRHLSLRGWGAESLKTQKINMKKKQSGIKIFSVYVSNSSHRELWPGYVIKELGC